jgi:tRNA(adenine34) deaminase
MGRMHNDELYMRMALAEARAAARAGEVPIGAVVVCGDVVISRGRNRRESDADPTAHAELVAVREAARALGRWRLSGCTVYVTLEPCPMCAGALHAARVSRCVYGAVDPKAGALGTLYDIASDERLNHRYEVTAGVLADESTALLREFFSALRARGRRAEPLEG